MDLSELETETIRRHPWEVARSGFFLRLLEKQGATRSPAPILDVGAGDAWFAQQLKQVLPETTPITCWDVNYTDLGVQSKGLHADGLVLTAKRPTGKFHGVLMLDVIEHVEHDLEFVRAIIHDLLDENGWALVSVPAYQRLFTAHDTALHHFRRYSPSQCRAVLESAGLVPVLQGGLFQSLLIVRGIQAARERIMPPQRSHGIGVWGGGDVLTKGVTQWLDLESRLSIEVASKTKFVLPGLSYWAYCVPSGR